MLFLIVLLVSCRGRVPAGEEPIDTATALRLVQTGTEGVEINFVPNYPPATIYDQNELIALLEVNNRGNHDLEASDCFIQISGFDPNIIPGNFIQACASNIGVLEGKNVYNVRGGQNQLEFRSSNINLNVYEYNPTLLAKACYIYQTTASPSVCIDPLLYQITGEQKACDYRRSIVTGGGQGAPVGIGYVGVDMVGGKAVFEINVVNQGGGRVLSPYADIRNCDAGLEYTDLDKVGYTVQMSGGSLIDCSPRDGLVRLSNNNGKIICRFDVPGSGAYETPLQISLQYGYVKSIIKPLKIIKTPGS